jgi:hypothetical protein
VAWAKWVALFVCEHAVLIPEALVEQRDGPEFRCVAANDRPVQPRDRFDASDTVQKERIQVADHDPDVLVGDGTIGTALESRHAALCPPVMSCVPLHDLAASPQ